MRRAEDLLPPEEQLRLAECVKEQLHLTGSVQPHGALLTVDATTFTVLQVSASTTAVLGAEPRALLGRPLAELWGRRWADELREELSGPDRVPAALPLEVGGVQLLAVAHRVDSSVVVEVERARTHGAAWLHSALESITQARSVRQLQDEAARLVRAVTGFDRVMVYHFHEDGHGEVVAEDRDEALEPYLGLHYPASDIPAQARRLYVRQLSRSIVDRDAAPAPLLPPRHPHTDEPLDLTRSQLRSVSPHHVAFLRNMGVAASLSLSLVHGKSLIGMISCGHRTPRHVPYAVRRDCEALARYVSLQLGALAERQRLQRELSAQRVRTELVEQMGVEDAVASALLRGSTTLTDLLPADGAAICLEDVLTVTGHVPSRDRLRELVERLTAGADEPGPLVTEALAEEHPDLAGLVPGTAGVVLVPLSRDGDFLAWFRRELAQTVDWLGDQGEVNRPTALSPRSSFSLWRQTVRGRCAPWDEVEVAQALELRRDIDNVLLRRAEARLAHLGMHDALTGLPNRRLLLDRLGHALDRHRRGAAVSLLFIDLDRFKLVNDSYGHDVGDALLLEAAERIRATTRASDTVARLGGDEFMVLCEDTDVEAAHLLADRVVASFEKPVRLDDREIGITASIGVTVAAQHQSPNDLLREADTAMYLAKEQGRNRASRFEAGLRYQAIRRLDTEQALRRGLDDGHLALHYQPIVRVDDRAVVGAEALLRWDRPGHGAVGPEDFIGLAEDSGFIVPLGQWVLDRALAQLAQWDGAGLLPDGFSMSVNLSPRQLLDPSFVPSVERLLDEHGTTPAALALEITETTLMSERSMMTDTVGRLAAMGVRLVIDDFGTGYSSLAYLRYLPIRELKVDRTFVGTMTTEPRDAAVVAAVVGLAHELGLSCVAEGVEDAVQMERLRGLGCDFAQGFHLGRPVPAGEATRRLSGSA